MTMPPLPHHPDSHTYGWTKPEIAAMLKYGEACAAAAATQPIDMVLHCPSCGLKHVDAPEACTEEGCPHHGSAHSHPDTWLNPPHKSHLCHECGTIWRPADVPTNGVRAIHTAGKSDCVKPPIRSDYEHA